MIDTELDLLPGPLKTDQKALEEQKPSIVDIATAREKEREWIFYQANYLTTSCMLVA